MFMGTVSGQGWHGIKEPWDKLRAQVHGRGWPGIKGPWDKLRAQTHRHGWHWDQGVSGLAMHGSAALGWSRLSRPCLGMH